MLLQADVSSTVAAPALRRQAMQVRQINRAIHALDRIPSASEVPRGYMLKVCAASEEAWNAYVESEDQALRSRQLVWINGSIFINEFPSDVHGYISRGICFAIHDHPVVHRYLISRGDSFNRTPGLPRFEPDESFHTSRTWLQSIGVGLPAGIQHWSDFVTLKVEVGVSRGWGEAQGYLDHKARFVWSTFPGVAYVLCVVVDSDLQHAEFKLYAIPGLNIGPPFIPIATPIQAPRAIARFDARRLLGIPPGSQLPPQFPDPFELDLFAVIEEAREDLDL